MRKWRPGRGGHLLWWLWLWGCLWGSLLLLSRTAMQNALFSAWLSLLRLFVPAPPTAWKIASFPNPRMIFVRIKQVTSTFASLAVPSPFAQASAQKANQMEIKWMTASDPARRLAPRAGHYLSLILQPLVSTWLGHNSSLITTIRTLSLSLSFLFPIMLGFFSSNFHQGCMLR